MPVEFICVNCQATYEVSNDLADKSVKCRECGACARVGAAPQHAAPPRSVSAVESDEPTYFKDALRIADLRGTDTTPENA